MRHIIIADDSATARMFVRRCMEIAGCRGDKFIEAADGKEVLDALEATQDEIDMVVTDLNMPVMDGEELLRRLRQDRRWRSIPILVITSAQNPAKETELMSLNATAVLSKPISPPKIVDILKQI
jgi:two-component system, chemotaxis family, chemotaxis protein CheY